MSDEPVLKDREWEKFQAYTKTEPYTEKLLKRARIQENCAKDPYAALAAIELCTKDPIFFIENFLWTFDPRKSHQPNHLPFFLFPYQEDLVTYIVEHIRKGKDLYIDKSRDMGVTWILQAVLFWFWRFDDSFSGLAGSRKEDLVDNNTRDSLFGIYDYYLDNLPKYMLPKRWNKGKHRRSMKLTNPENFNLITGESMNPDFGRQSRKTVAIFDEFAFWDYAKEAWAAAGDTTPCRIAVTTPNGFNYAAKLRESGQVDVRSLHWKLHPLKDEEWYKDQCSRRTEEEIAQELDISYQKSLVGRVYPEWSNIKWGDYLYDNNLPLFVSWDFGLTDNTAIIWYQVDRNQVRIIDCYSNAGKTIDFYIPFITGEVVSDLGKYTHKDLAVIAEHKQWRPAVHYGDPAGRFTNQVVDKSVIDILKNHGIVVNFREEAKDFKTRRTESKLLIPNLVIHKSERNEYLDLCMLNAAYPKSTSGGEEQVNSVKPKHDWTSHFRSSFEYFAVNYRYASKHLGRVWDKIKRPASRRVVGY